MSGFWENWRDTRRRRRSDRKRRRADRKRDRAELLDTRATDLERSTGRDEATLIVADPDGVETSQRIAIRSDAAMMRDRRIATLERKITELSSMFEELRDDVDEIDESFEESTGRLAQTEAASMMMSQQTLIVISSMVGAINASEAPVRPWALQLSEGLNAYLTSDNLPDSQREWLRVASTGLKAYAYLRDNDLGSIVRADLPK